MAYQQTNTREVILEALLEITEEGRYSHLVMRGVLDKYGYLERQERAFITKVTEGTIERLITIDYIINCFSKVRTERMKPVIRAVLRSAVFQMMYLDSVPVSAVVNEAVKLTVKRGFGGLRNFVNGVLRGIDRGRDKLVWPDKETDAVSYLSAVYSLPSWIADMWLKRFGLAVTEQIASSFFGGRDTYVRVNTSRIDTESYLRLLKKAGISSSVSPFVPDAVALRGYDSVRSIPGYKEGFFQVQDISSMIVGEAADVHPDSRCLDVCASPGGKTLHLADRILVCGTGPQGEKTSSGSVAACDVSEYKLGLIRDNISRCRFSNVKTVLADARAHNQRWENSFDIVIADLPCSGLGVLGRKSDLKYRMTPETVAELAGLQAEMLKNVRTYVKPGGMLIYSTCTISRPENEDNAEKLAGFGDMERINPQTLVPEEIRHAFDLIPHSGEMLSHGYIQLLPGFLPCDGFFLACFRRICA